MANRKNPESSSSLANNHDDATTNKDQDEEAIKAPNENEVYQPSLVHLKCRGALYLASPDHRAICKGVSSRLETIREYPPMKPRAALHTFKNQTSFYHPPDGDNDDSYQAGFGFGSENADSQQIRNHRAHAAPKTKERKMDLPVVVDTKWTEMKDTLQEQAAVDLTKLDATQSEMTIYGVSSAYFLVLKPYSEMRSTAEKNEAIFQNEDDEKNRVEQTRKVAEESKAYNEDSRENTGTRGMGDDSIGVKSYIYAVNPVNEFGVAKRKVSSKKNGVACTSTTVKLGILEITMASLEEVKEVDAENTQSVSTDSSLTSRNSHSKIEQGQGVKQSTAQQDDFSSSKPTTISLPSLPSLKEMLQFLEKVDMASDKIQNQMYQNAKFVKDELENDFVSRTFNASQKVAGDCKKNLVRMRKMGGDIINFLSDAGKD